MKQIIGLIIISLLVGAAMFFWWQDQKDVRDLNRGLPDGIRVVESLFGNEYKVVNKIDGYEFKVPDWWRDIKKITYQDVTNNDLGFRKDIDKETKEVIISESALAVESEATLGWIEIRGWGFNNNVDFNTFVLKFKSAFVPSYKTEHAEIFSKIAEVSIGEFKVLKIYTTLKPIRGSESDSDEYFFLNSKSKIYGFDGFNEEAVREIISNGKW